MNLKGFIQLKEVHYIYIYHYLMWNMTIGSYLYYYTCIVRNIIYKIKVDANVFDFPFSNFYH